MYEFVAHPMGELGCGGLLLVHSMRGWVIAMNKRICPGNIIAPLFARWGLLPGLHPFLRMMALFNRHGLEDSRFGRPCCNRVSEHEAIILALLCNLRGPRPEVAGQTLQMLVDEEAVGDTLLSLPQLGQTMTAANVHPEYVSSETR